MPIVILSYVIQLALVVHVLKTGRNMAWVFILLFCVAFAFFGWPQVLWILFVIPAVVVVWIERTRFV